MDLKQTKQYLNQEGFVPSKKMGQNFLVDKNIQANLVKMLNLTKDEYILEIGPGLGAISKYLKEISSNLILVELDKRLYDYLSSTFKDLIIINNDILKLDLFELKQQIGFNSLKVVSNIPYSISSKIVLYLMKYDFINQINLLVQKEMAEHICAKLNSENYNSFSVLVQTYYDCKILQMVAKSAFIPQPQVESAFIQLNKINQNYPFSFNQISEFLKLCFHSRRKTLINNLIIKYDKNLILKVFNQINLNLNIRAQELNKNQFHQLYGALVNEK